MRITPRVCTSVLSFELLFIGIAVWTNTVVLHNAAQSGDLDVVKKLITDDAKLDLQTVKVCTRAE